MIKIATRCNIGIKTEDGLYKTVYCHYDGYISHTLKILQEFYNTEEKVEELLSYGDLIILRETIEASEFFHRDKGEVLKKPSLSATWKCASATEYLYIFQNGSWSYSKNC